MYRPRSLIRKPTTILIRPSLAPICEIVTEKKYSNTATGWIERGPFTLLTVIPAWVLGPGRGRIEGINSIVSATVLDL